MTPIYRDQRPSAFRFYEGSSRYDKGICPVSERLYEKEMLLLGMVRPPCTRSDMDDIVAAMEKVAANRHAFAQAAGGVR